MVQKRVQWQPACLLPLQLVSVTLSDRWSSSEHRVGCSYVHPQLHQRCSGTHKQFVRMRIPASG
jgi:hypothetical protein